MKIIIVTGKGKGVTKIAAFDKALLDAGINNYNLIYLSSIIPPHSEIVQSKKYIGGREHFGNKLYVVISKNFQIFRDRECWAGLGWTQTKDGKGLFVEHCDKTNENVICQIKQSLHDMVKNRKESFGKIHYCTSGVLG